MPAKNILIDRYQCKGHETLETLASVMRTRGFFTSNQAKSFEIAIRPLMPCTVTIEQRLPKSVIYVTADNKRFTINNRAKLIGVNT